MLVVGGSHSGTDIAYEVAPTHPTVLCGRDPGQIPVRLEKKGARLFFPVFLFVGKHVLTRRTPMGRKELREVRYHGGPALRVKRADLLARGSNGSTSGWPAYGTVGPVLDDGRVMDVTNVVWCTGFRQVFDWIDVPVIGADGWPEESRGVVPAAPGLFFCGLSFQFAFTLDDAAGRRPRCRVRRRAHRRPVPRGRETVTAA